MARDTGRREGLRLLIPAREIRRAVKRIGEEIGRDYRRRTPLLVCVLRGAVVFLSDLIREIPVPVELDFVRLASYGASTRSSGEVKILKDLEVDVAGRDVIVVEDIVDTGQTLRYLTAHLRSYRPRSVRICALVRRTGTGRRTPRADYVGFEVGPGFLVGYGLDLAESYRQLPAIYATEGT